MAFKRINANAIKRAAEEWAQGRDLDLGDLDQSQQQQAAEEVAKSMGLGTAEVFETLMEQWTSLNESRGRKLELQGDGGAYLGASTQRSLQGSGLGLYIQNKLDAKSVGTFGPESLEFRVGRECIASTQTFVIPIPRLAGGGQPLQNPETGAAITDREGRELSGQGFVFRDPKLDAWRAAPGDGSGVIVARGVDDDQAEKLEKLIGDPARLTIDRLGELMETLHETLGISDTFGADHDYVTRELAEIEELSTGIQAFGQHRHGDNDVWRAVLVEGNGALQIGDAEPQKFDNGAVIMKRGDEVRLLDPDEFLDTFFAKNGAWLELEDLPTAQPTKSRD